MEDYTPIVRICLVSGFHFRFHQDSRIQLVTQCQTSDEDRGFNVSELQSAPPAIAWPGQELLEFLTLVDFTIRAIHHQYLGLHRTDRLYTIIGKCLQKTCAKSIVRTDSVHCHHSPEQSPFRVYTVSTLTGKVRTHSV